MFNGLSMPNHYKDSCVNIELNHWAQCQNNSSVLLENGCSEIGKIEGEVFFPREKFPFPRSDSCLAERSEGRQSRSRKRKVLSRKRRAWDFFYRRVTFFSSTDTFSLALDPWLSLRFFQIPGPLSFQPYRYIFSICGASTYHKSSSKIAFTFTRALLRESIIYIHTYFIIENFACKIFNYKISMYVYDRFAQ